MSEELGEGDLRERIVELERALEASEQRNRELLRAMDHVPSGIEIYDADGVAQYLNPAMMKMITISSTEEVIGYFNILTDPFSAETGIRPLYERAYAGETVFTDEFSVAMERAAEDWGTTSSDIWFKMILVPTFDSGGKVSSVVALMFETTEARQMARTLQLVSRRDGIELLAGGVAHDYNNLLSAIITNAQIVRETSTEKEVIELNEDVLRASEQAVFLTKQLLAYTGRNERSISTLDLGVLTDGITQVFRNSILQVGSINLDFSPSECLAEVDAGQYKQVVMNLLTNAIEALPSDGGLVQVKLRQVELGASELESFQFSEQVEAGLWNVLEIHDNGSGMDDDTRLHIFEPYFTTKATGHGLGLAATLGIIWNHGGGISVTSEKGSGTSFRILLPTSAHSITSTMRLERQDTLPESATLLIVDNSPYLRASLRALLERLNFTLYEAEDGLDAVERLKSLKQAPDMILMEIMTPHLNGLDVLRLVRDNDPTLPVLLMSSHGEVGQRGVSGDPYASFLQKPFDSAAILSQIAQMLGGSP